MLWIVIPAKAPPFAKSRLGRALSDAQRAMLVRGMVIRTLAIARDAAPNANILLVSNSEEFCGIALSLGALVMADEGGSLNAALELAAAAIPPADSMLVLPTDLPLLSAAKINIMTCTDADCAIAPNRSRDGTNALYWKREPRFFLFGAGSFAAHVNAATESGLSMKIIEDTDIAFDLDCPDELFELLGKRQCLLTLYGLKIDALACSGE